MKIKTKIHFNGDTLLVEGRLMNYLVSSNRLILRYRKDYFIKQPYTLIFETKASKGDNDESYLPEKTNEALCYNTPSLVEELRKEKFLTIHNSAINVVGFEGVGKYVVALTKTRVKDDDEDDDKE